MDRQRIEAFSSIPHKAHRVLILFLCAMLIIMSRLWYVTIVQQDKIEQSALRTRKKVVVTPAYRGTIRDRFQMVLAANVIDYRVGIQYAPIQQIPFRSTVSDRVRYFRREYVDSLCATLGSILGEDPSTIRDLIHSYAVFAPNSTIIIKTNLHETDYYRLNMMAKDWPGLVVERSYRRVYPRGRTAAHLLGYTASLNREEYDALMSELLVLRTYVRAVERGDDQELPLGCSSFFEAKKRLMMLERMSYGINDEIGKMGVEASYERDLRGYYGKQYFYTNARGAILKEAPGSFAPVCGKRLVLTISARLQEACERLLIASEAERAERLQADTARIHKGAKDPFVRGGAIVAMDPRTGEVLACASHPRFDPNDFVKTPPSMLKQAPSRDMDRWLESDQYLRRVFDGEIPLIRERIHRGALDDACDFLSWDRFLEAILPRGAHERDLLASGKKAGILLSLQGHPGIGGDLARLILRREELSESIIAAVRDLSIGEIREMICARVALGAFIKEELRPAFIMHEFQEWRQREWPIWLARIRKKEEATHTAKKPFLKYLEMEKDRQFGEFLKSHELRILLFALGCWDSTIPTWAQEAIHTRVTGRCSLSWDGSKRSFHQSNYQDEGSISGSLADTAAYVERHRSGLIRMAGLVKSLPTDEALCLLRALKGYADLTFEVQGDYTGTTFARRPKVGRDLIRSILSLRAPPMVSLCYMSPSAPGSIFKIIVAFCALRQQVQMLKDDVTKLSSNLLKLWDQTMVIGGRVYVGRDSTGRLIPQLYKGGRIPKSVSHCNGQLDLVAAIAKSSNPYFAILASEFIESPQRLLQTARSLGYGRKTGIRIPSEAMGRLPTDLSTNTTGLYTTAIGQHTLLATPLQTAVALCALSNNGAVVTPGIVKAIAGARPISEHDLMTTSGIGYSGLKALGISVPIWLSDTARFHKREIEIPTTQVRRVIPISREERAILYQGMQGALLHALDEDFMQKLRLEKPTVFSIVRKIRCHMIGKSSTAESFERLGLGVGQPPCMYNHTWFAGLYFDLPIQGKDFFLHHDPSLVVVLFLRYGTYGKDAAHLAACICHEWEKIRQEALET